MYEAVEFVEVMGEIAPRETSLGVFEDELEAVHAARSAKRDFFTSGSADYAWWIVREEGAQLAHFIADSKSDKEFVLDLRSGELVQVPS
jgi:hypothetical protein